MVLVDAPLARVGELGRERHLALLRRLASSPLELKSAAKLQELARVLGAQHRQPMPGLFGRECRMLALLAELHVRCREQCRQVRLIAQVAHGVCRRRHGWPVQVAMVCDRLALRLARRPPHDGRVLLAGDNRLGHHHVVTGLDHAHAPRTSWVHGALAVHVGGMQPRRRPVHAWLLPWLLVDVDPGRPPPGRMGRGTRRERWWCRVLQA